MRKIIYDFGANNGDDISYYLMKADLVVAVEANPALCELIKERFQHEINTHKLIVVNCVLTNSNELSEVDFYIHRKDHVLSQFPAPKKSDLGSFEKTQLPAQSAAAIIAQYGSAYYVKIDIEHYDSQILRVLFDNDIRPPYISAESHSIEIFSLLVSNGHYNAFKLVKGDEVEQTYSNRVIEGNDADSYSFARHSAGPFGEDIDGEWMSADNFYRLLAFEGLGWRDVHATNLHEPNPKTVITAREFYLRRAKRIIKDKLLLPFQGVTRG